MGIKHFIAAAALVASPLAFAHNCPSLVEEVNDMIETNAHISADTVIDKENDRTVEELRDEGAALHAAGKHSESVQLLQALQRAMELL